MKSVTAVFHGPAPTPDVPFSERLQATGGLGDLNHDYETGLFWDMLTDWRGCCAAMRSRIRFGNIRENTSI